MTYITEQLRGMSDFEVNKAVALKLHPDATVVRSYPDSGSITIYAKEFTKIMVDYCNNQSDIMPLAFDNLCRIEKVNGLWVAESNAFDGVYCYRFQHESPLRAIACCLLMM